MPAMSRKGVGDSGDDEQQQPAPPPHPVLHSTIKAAALQYAAAAVSQEIAGQLPYGSRQTGDNRDGSRLEEGGGGAGYCQGRNRHNQAAAGQQHRPGHRSVAELPDFDAALHKKSYRGYYRDDKQDEEAATPSGRQPFDGGIEGQNSCAGDWNGRNGFSDSRGSVGGSTVVPGGAGWGVQRLRDAVGT